MAELKADSRRLPRASRSLARVVSVMVLEHIMVLGHITTHPPILLQLRATNAWPKRRSSAPSAMCPLLGRFMEAGRATRAGQAICRPSPRLRLALSALSERLRAALEVIWPGPRQTPRPAFGAICVANVPNHWLAILTDSAIVFCQYCSSYRVPAFLRALFIRHQSELDFHRLIRATFTLPGPTPNWSLFKR